MADRVFSSSEKSGFIVKPTDDTGRVVFEGKGFDIDEVGFITDVFAAGKNEYRFAVGLKTPILLINELGSAEKSDVMYFYYQRKNEALSRQRELCRAWTRTGEFNDFQSATSST